ncbi:MAG: hypothetical protein JXB47_13235 [Anaerolineae bacterium]|nr:hypothetical protein [Anaerolineae bacterium]
MTTREQNERKFPNWVELPDGGRRYWRDVPGRHSGMARYVKIVGADEMTISFVQEVYDDEGVLIAIHSKYPKDTGHQILVDEGSDI